MKYGKIIIFGFVLFFLFLLLASFTLAQQEEKREKEIAYEAILAAKDHMSKMQAADFSVRKVNDTILEATTLYEAQVALEEKTGSADYSRVIKAANSVAEIRKEAFKVYDELNALETRLKELSKSQDMSEAIKIFNEAKKEFEDERYEQTSEAIERCYKKINELQATLTRLKAIYEASTKTIAGFFARNYKAITIAALILLITYFFLGGKIRCYFINRAIRKLEIEKQTLNSLIKKAQYEYFQKGTVSEATYRIRISKFSELVRDINRRIPLLKVKIERVEKGKEKRLGFIKRHLYRLGLLKTKEEKQKVLKLKQERERLKKEELKKEEGRKRGEKRRKEEEKLKKKEEKKRKKETERRGKLREKEKKKEEERLEKEGKRRRKGLLVERAEKLKREKIREKAEKAKLEEGKGAGELEKKREEEKREKEVEEEQKKLAAKPRVKKEILKKEKEERKKEPERKKVEKVKWKEEKRRLREEKKREKLRKKQEKNMLKEKRKREKEERKKLREIGFKKIKDYIKNTKREGFSEEQIKTKLLERGWPSKLVEEAFKEAGKSSE